MTGDDYQKNTCTSLLHAILAFEPVQRYHGMLPRHVAVCIYHPEHITTAISLDLICWDIFIDEDEREIKGLRLTAHGREVLEELSL